jgi:hypothetical protein
MSGDLVQILEGNTFVVSDARGDIEASPTDPTGLFSNDTRFLSQRLNALSTDDLNYFETRFFLVPGTGTVYIDAKLSVIRERSVGRGFRETLAVLNHDAKPADLDVQIAADSDFADLFEVKDALKKKGEYHNHVDGDTLVLGYRRETFERETRIRSSEPASLDESGLSFAAHVEPHGEWRTELDVGTWFGVLSEAMGDVGRDRRRPSMARGLEKWVGAAPRLECDWDPLEATYRRSLVDLAALRLEARTMPRPSHACRGPALVYDHVRA